MDGLLDLPSRGSLGAAGMNAQMADMLALEAAKETVPPHPRRGKSGYAAVMNCRREKKGVEIEGASAFRCGGYI